MVGRNRLLPAGRLFPQQVLPSIVPVSRETANASFQRPRIRVLIIEDHPMMRQGMRSLFESTEDIIVCGEAGTAEEALEKFREERPDVCCVDLVLGGVDGIGLIEQLRTIDPRARVLVLSVRDEQAFAERCMRAGALGYAMKTGNNETLLTGVRRVACGEVHLSPRLAMTLLTRVHRPPKAQGGISTLSEREMQVFQLVGLGVSTRQIAARLGIGMKTVETHRESIKNKLGLEHAAALVHKATVWVQESLES